MPKKKEPPKSFEEEVKCIFKTYDKRKKGVWTIEDLGRAMEELGVVTNDDKLKQTFNKLDKHNKGKLEYNEFLEHITSELARLEAGAVAAGIDQETAILEAFQMFDYDGNGFIDTKELHMAMKKLGETLSHDECLAMMREADLNGDGKIDYKEFTRKWYQCR